MFHASICDTFRSLDLVVGADMQKIFSLMMCIACGFSFEATAEEASDARSSDKKAIFVDIKDIDSTIMVDARYAGSANFTGKVVPGYKASKCLLTSQAAIGLAKAQAVLKTMGLSLKAYDCYRPQEAVTAFMAWAKGRDNPRLKRFYYPKENIEKLFERGYIAEKSGHSRGSTIDLTIAPAGVTKPLASVPSGSCFTVPGLYDRDGSLNMGTSFDCFDERSYTADDQITPASRAHRLLLKTVMEQAGFKNYEKEWWHYTLAEEPFTDRYFTEPVQ
jgi:D-alanyl-D-alanine dipeptidase